MVLDWDDAAAAVVVACMPVIAHRARGRHSTQSTERWENRDTDGKAKGGGEAWAALRGGERGSNCAQTAVSVSGRPESTGRAGVTVVRAAAVPSFPRVLPPVFVVSLCLSVVRVAFAACACALSPIERLKTMQRRAH